MKKPINSGRKPLDSEAPSVIVHTRMTEAQHIKLKALGGAVWQRKMIDYAYDAMPKK